MHLQFTARTDVGQQRDHNEDNFLVDPALQLFVVADGMGGHSAGEVASAMAVNVVSENVAKAQALLDTCKADPSKENRHAVLKVLEHAVEDACYRIFDQGLNSPQQRGMGTTLTLMVVVGSRGYVAHVGDSRLYLIREREVHLLTEDHSLLNDLLKHGKIKSTKDLDVRFKNAVTRAVGVHEAVEVDSLDFDIFPEDRFLICSDGLHGYLDNDRIREMSAGEDLDAIADGYIQFANRKGGIDNITCVFVAATDTEGDHSLALTRFNTVKHLRLFQFLNHQELIRILHVCGEARYAAGQKIFSEGDEEECLYVLIEGNVEIRKSGVLLATLERGAHFGEMALIDRVPRSADAIASTDALVLMIDRKAFYETMRNNSPMAVKVLWSFAKSLTDRLRTTSADLQDLKDSPVRVADLDTVPEELISDLPKIIPTAVAPDDKGEMSLPEPLAPLARLGAKAAPPPLPPGVKPPPKPSTDEE